MKKIVAIAISIAFIITIFASSAFSASASTLPDEYNSDPSNVQFMTSVKSQGEFGNCWAFAAIACCEAEAIKNHGASKNDIDLSELHLAYFGYNGERSTGDTVTAYSPFYQHGGYSQLPIFTFSSWIGLVDESVAPYESFTRYPINFSLNSNLMYQSVEYYVENAYTYSLPNDIDRVKQAIITYGAVQTSYYSNEYYLNSVASAQYCPTSYSPDHAVTIVGWNDTYSRTNFNSTNRPQKDGAWLVKNSWGEDWGIDGYFWLSYEDKSATSATAYDVTPTNEFEYDNNYQHDGGIALTYSPDYSRNAAANIFTARSNEELLAVSIMTYDIPNADYSLKIYVNPEELTPSGFNKGTPIHEQSGALPEAGYTTIPLTTPIDLYEDDVFVVLIETNAFIALDADQDITQGNTTLVRSDAAVKQNQTYFSVDGGGFYDPYSQSMPFNARIKAFTRNTELGTAQFQALPAASSIEYGQTLGDIALTGGRVIDSISQRIIRGAWSFAEPNTIPKNGDTAKIIFTPDNADYGVIEMTITVSVAQSTPILTITTDKRSFKDGDTIKVMSTVQNEHSPSLDDLPTMRLYYQIDNGEKHFFTDSFVMPSDISGSRLTIGVITDAIESKYTAGEKTISFTTPKIEESTNADEGDSTIIPDITDITSDNTDDIPIIDVEESKSHPSKDQIDSNKSNSQSFGCFSSAHISAIFTIATLTGIAFIRKRRYD